MCQAGWGLAGLTLEIRVLKAWRRTPLNPEREFLLGQEGNKNVCHLIGAEPFVALHGDAVLLDDQQRSVWKCNVGRASDASESLAYFCIVVFKQACDAPSQDLYVVA